MSCCCPSGRWWHGSAPRRERPLEFATELTVEPAGEAPHVPPRLLGWLKLLHRKACIDDDWSRSGAPHPSWDSYSGAPLTSWPRFDLIESALVVAVLADLTPAWRELYVDILDRLVARYVTWWGAVDWMTLKGRDPQRHAYPERWRGTLVPEELFGDYEAPGWTGDGIEPWGHQPDPIGAEGNLFYKGFLSLLLGLRARLSGEDRWEDRFAVVPDSDEGGWVYSYRSVNETLVRQWGSRPEGCHCENTKIWPLCLSAAGLGLIVRDGNAGSDSHWVFDQWFVEAERRYLRYGRDGAANGSVLYHDPIAEVSMPGTPATDLALAFYLSAQRPETAAQLWSALVKGLGWRDADHPIRGHPKLVGLGRVLARELGDSAVVRLDAYADGAEPTRTNDGSFFLASVSTRRTRADSRTRRCCWPRRSTARVAGARRSARSRTGASPSVRRGVDFPTLGLHQQAAFDPRSESLVVSTYAASAANGGTTSFTVAGLHPRVGLEDERTLEITCSAGEHHFHIARGEAGA